MTEQCNSAGGSNWFVHVYVDGDDASDPEKWVIAIDHSYHAGQLPFFETQYCREANDRGGYPTADDIVPLAPEIKKYLGIKDSEPTKGAEDPEPAKGGVYKAPYMWYVHKYQNDPAIINTVYSNSPPPTKHCPTKSDGTPDRFGYPLNALEKALQAQACMDAGTCPPCLR